MSVVTGRQGGVSVEVTRQACHPWNIPPGWFLVPEAQHSLHSLLSFLLLTFPHCPVAEVESPHICYGSGWG